ncbi:MAG: glycosyltransferase family 39 protein [Methanomicrobia archaeon]|nr:glycosyltransferase family 39 protein [Methanomicrobia archaeon]
MAIEKKALVEISAIVLAIKFFAFILALIAWIVLHNQSCDFISLWNRWDAPHYVAIAESGYTAVGENRYFIVFLPLYPFLIRLAAAGVGNYELAALIVSNLASLLACFYLYKLARIDYAESTALQSVFFFSIFPTSYFLIAGYTESLFLLLAIGSFYYARKAKWSVAGVLGALAATTRMTGLVLVPALLWEYHTQHAEHPKPPIAQQLKDLTFIGMICLGFLVYLAVNYWVYGTPLAFLEVQHEHWYKQLAPPWEGLVGALASIFWREPVEKVLVGGAEVVFGILGLFCTIYALFIKLRPSYIIYMLLTWLMVASTSYWLSMPRYALSLFPLFMIFAVVADKRQEWHYVMTIAFLLFFSFFLVLFTQGYWAF